MSALRIINHFTKAVTEAGANANAAMLPPSTAGAAAFNESSAVRADAAIPSDNEPLNELEASLRGANARLNDSLDLLTTQHEAALSAYLLTLVRNEISKRAVTLINKVARAAGLAEGVA